MEFRPRESVHESVKGNARKWIMERKWKIILVFSLVALLAAMDALGDEVDPSAEQLNLQDKLMAINRLYRRTPYVPHIFHEYKSQVLSQLGRKGEAELEREAMLKT